MNIVWTKQNPAMPGWYWARNLRIPLLGGRYRLVEEFGVVEVLQDPTSGEFHISVTGSDWTAEMSKVEGEWAGPLDPPT
ncbi:MAG TPA: hypothetical protein VFS39_18665 [Nitrospira sp.]|nr:hypothetical protein [Nitrospira sp.]